MSSVEEVFVDIKKLAIDTSPLIYYVETHPKYDSVVAPIFNLIEKGSISGLSSIITLMEVLTKPLRMGNIQLCNEYRKVLLSSANFEIVSLDAKIAERAASIRAEYGIRSPDALQLAAAIEMRCDAFLTNDTELKRVKEIRVLVLDELHEQL